VSTTSYTPDRFTTWPDDQTLGATIVALEEHGTLEQTGIADAINEGDRYDSARTKMFSLDFATQVKEMKAVGGQPDYALEAARQRIYQHSLKLEDARAIAAYGQHSAVGKILETHQEQPDRIHVVFVRQLVGF
jgi:hypothetical protein